MKYRPGDKVRIKHGTALSACHIDGNEGLVVDNDMFGHKPPCSGAVAVLSANWRGGMLICWHEEDNLEPLFPTKTHNFVVSIDDEYCEWSYPLTVSPDHTINSIWQIIREALGAPQAKAVQRRQAFAPSDIPKEINVCRP